jgi:hypothetical protein
VRGFSNRHHKERRLQNKTKKHQAGSFFAIMSLSRTSQSVSVSTDSLVGDSAIALLADPTMSKTSGSKGRPFGSRSAMREGDAPRTNEHQVQLPQEPSQPPPEVIFAGCELKDASKFPPPRVSCFAKCAGRELVFYSSLISDIVL